MDKEYVADKNTAIVLSSSMALHTIGSASSNVSFENINVRLPVINLDEISMGVTAPFYISFNSVTGLVTFKCPMTPLPTTGNEVKGLSFAPWAAVIYR